MNLCGLVPLAFVIGCFIGGAIYGWIIGDYWQRKIIIRGYGHFHPYTKRFVWNDTNKPTPFDGEGNAKSP